MDTLNYKLELYAIANDEGEILKEGYHCFLGCFYRSVKEARSSEAWWERPRRAGWKIVKVKLAVHDLE